ncbi:MAG: hypothetical protein ACRCVU_21020 [Flavobacterium sp.]
MKKILYTLVALAFSSATFAQMFGSNAVKSDEFYPGAIFSEQSLKGLNPAKIATTTNKTDVILPLSLLEYPFTISDYSKESWNKIIEKYYPKLSESDSNESFYFSTPSKVNSLKYYDKAYNTYEAIKHFFGVDAITTKNIFFGKSEQIIYSLSIDIPEDGKFISDKEYEKIKGQNPIVINQINFGKRADILVASNQDEVSIRRAFSIYKDKETNRYEEARKLLADASIQLIFFGKNSIDISELTNEEIILAYIAFITKPAIKEDYFFPISYGGAVLNSNNAYYESDIMKDTYK